MPRARSLRVLFVRPGDRQGLHPGLSFPVARERGDVLPLGLLALASAVKFGSSHRALVHDDRRPGASERGPAASLRGLSRALQPDVAVIWLHPALLADGLEAARQARHAGCATVLGAGPLVQIWPEAAARVLEVDGVVGTAAGLLAALEVLSDGGGAAALAGASGAIDAARWPVDRKLLDYAAYDGAGGPPWPGIGRPRGVRSDKGRFAASPVVFDDGAAADVAACVLLGIRFVDLVGGGGDEAAWSARVAALPAAPRMRLQASPSRLRGLSLTELRGKGVEALDLGPLGAGAAEAVEEACLMAQTALRAGFSVAATAQIGVAGYAPSDEDRGLARLRGAGLLLDVRVPVRPGGERWEDHADAPSAGFVPPGVDPERLALTGAPALRTEGRVRGIVARLRG